MSENLWRRDIELRKRNERISPDEEKKINGWYENLKRNSIDIVQNNKRLDNSKKNFEGISVVIPVYNRAHLLDITLSSLYEQKFTGKLEIIIVDDRSTDNIEEIIDKHNNVCGVINHIKIKKGHVPKLRSEYIQHIIGPTNNIHVNGNYAINVGVKRSKYDIILLTGAEIYHLGNTIQVYYDKHVENNFDWLWIEPYGAREIIGDDNTRRELLRSAHNDFIRQISDKKYIDENWLKRWNFRLTFSYCPDCVSFIKGPFCLIHGFDEDDYGWGWGDLELIERMKSIGVKFMQIQSPISPYIMWIHLYHDLLDLSDGGTYNRLIALDKRLNNISEDFFSINGNRRNLDGWGELKYTLHEFAREFYWISDEEYNFWSTRSYGQLNQIYNEIWKRYKKPLDFYKYGTEYSLGTTFKQLHNFSGNKNECRIPTIEGDTVLDYACGLGDRSLGYYHRGSKLTLMDIDSPMFRMIQKYYTYCKGYDIEFIPITDDNTFSIIHRKWDVVICLDALHHMQDPKDILNLLMEHTNKYLIVNTGYQNNINLHISKIDISKELLSKFEFIEDNTFKKIE